MLTEHSYILLELLRTEPVLFALFILFFDIPRYTLSLVTMLTWNPWAPQKSDTALTVAAVIPVKNGELGIAACVEGLFCQSHPVTQVTIVDDGSDDGTWAELERLRERFPDIRLLRHAQSAGKSASVNHGALVSEADLLLVLDDDVIIDRDFVHLMTTAFSDPQVAAASGNLFVSNRTANPLAALQSMEYLQSITLGRTFLDKIGSLACISGAVSMFRKPVFDEIGGLNVGPGEDLEISLRIRKTGYRLRFVTEATAYTKAALTWRALVRQRLRWDRDAINIRVFKYRQHSIFLGDEPLSDTLMRLDFVLLELLPTLVFPFYLMATVLYLGAAFLPYFLGLMALLFWFYLMHGLFSLFVARVGLKPLEIAILPLMPLYQGVFLKLVRFVAFTREILFADSRNDTFVPERIRRSLYEQPQNE